MKTIRLKSRMISRNNDPIKPGYDWIFRRIDSKIFRETNCIVNDSIYEIHLAIKSRAEIAFFI